MKAKLKYTTLFCFLITTVFSQTLNISLTKGNSQLFNNYLYTFGISIQKQNAACVIYKLDLKLKIIDSSIIDLGKSPLDNFLQTNSDTLHGFLNIYVQRKDKKQVTVIRFNKLFERIAIIENVDIARLNSISNFETELFYHKKAN